MADIRAPLYRMHQIKDRQTDESRFASKSGDQTK
jgi:hypothetical protein